MEGGPGEGRMSREGPKPDHARLRELRVHPLFDRRRDRAGSWLTGQPPPGGVEWSRFGLGGALSSPKARGAAALRLTAMSGSRFHEATGPPAGPRSPGRDVTGETPSPRSAQGEVAPPPKWATCPGGVGPPGPTRNDRGLSLRHSDAGRTSSLQLPAAHPAPARGPAQAARPATELGRSAAALRSPGGRLVGSGPLQALHELRSKLDFAPSATSHGEFRRPLVAGSGSPC